MFCMFGPTYSEVQESMSKQTACTFTLLEILIENGLITEEEFKRRADQNLARVDQMVAKLKDEQLAEIPKEQREAVEFLRRIAGEP